MDNRGRPRTPKKLRKASRTFSCTDTTARAITSIAARLKVSKSEVIELALVAKFPSDFEHLQESA